MLHPEDKDLVFFAGGIGITPFMSMLRHMRDTESDLRVVLLYANRSEADIVFRNELTEMEEAEKPRLRVVHILSNPGSNWTGERGHVDREKIGRFVGPIDGKSFICVRSASHENQLNRYIEGNGRAIRAHTYRNILALNGKAAIRAKSIANDTRELKNGLQKTANDNNPS